MPEISLIFEDDDSPEAGHYEADFLPRIGDKVMLNPDGDRRIYEITDVIHYSVKGTMCCALVVKRVPDMAEYHEGIAARWSLIADMTKELSGD